MESQVPEHFMYNKVPIEEADAVAQVFGCPTGQL